MKGILEKSIGDCYIIYRLIAFQGYSKYCFNIILL